MACRDGSRRSREPELSAAVGFYHLTRSRPERALGRLLLRALAGGKRATVLVPDAAAAAALDDALWTEGDGAWLPHGAYAATDRRAALCPVWITKDGAAVDPPPNGATFLFLVGLLADDVTTAIQQTDRFERVFDLFDGASAPAVDAARTRWREARTHEPGPVYWRETPTGWEQAG